MKITVERVDRHVAIVTIDNQPRLNAMTRDMMRELGAVWDELETDETRCIIVTGAGERGFCVGADLSGDLTASEEMATIVNHSLLKCDSYSKPIIAAVNGDCVGGGLELLLSTDIRGCVATARFGLPEVKWSVYPFGGATLKLVDQIGYIHAMDLLLTGELIDAEKSMELGIVNEVFESHEELVTWAINKAMVIARNGPRAVQAVKKQVSDTISTRVRSRELVEQRLGEEVRASADFKEGVAAFLEKRKPIY
jgi:enoyl-CoA hydratase/carnithine racemase